MAWMDDSRNNSTTDNFWLKFPTLNNVGDRAEIRMRVISGDSNVPNEPSGVWQHWLEGRPFNCCEPAMRCPVCAARKLVPQAQQKTDFPLRSRQFFNVLVEENGRPAVKVFGFGFGISKDLKSFSQRYGDLRNYDITVRQEKVGRLPMNVDYSVFYEKESPLTPEQIEAAKEVHDLSQFTQPAAIEDLSLVARGIFPTAESKAPVTQDQMERAHLIGELKKRIPQDLDLKNFGIYDDSPNEKLQSLLDSLKGN